MRALEAMAHRAGSVGEEGDGCGVQVDIPRRLWADRLRSHLPFPPGFAVAHLAGRRPGAGAARPRRRAGGPGRAGRRSRRRRAGRPRRHAAAVAGGAAGAGGRRRCCRTGWRWSGRACTSPPCRGRPASTRCSATPRGCCRSPPTWSIRCSRRGWRSPTAATRPTRCPPSSACSRSGASPTTARSTPSGGCGWSCPAWGRSRCAEPATPRTWTCWWACCSTAVWRWTRCWRCCFRRCSRAARSTATTAPCAGRWRRARPR